MNAAGGRAAARARRPRRREHRREVRGNHRRLIDQVALRPPPRPLRERAHQLGAIPVIEAAGIPCAIPISASPQVWATPRPVARGRRRPTPTRTWTAPSSAPRRRAPGRWPWIPRLRVHRRHRPGRAAEGSRAQPAACRRRVVSEGGRSLEWSAPRAPPPRSPASWTWWRSNPVGAGLTRAARRLGLSPRRCAGWKGRIAGRGTSGWAPEGRLRGELGPLASHPQCTGERRVRARLLSRVRGPVPDRDARCSTTRARSGVRRGFSDAASDRGRRHILLRRDPGTRSSRAKRTRLTAGTP